MIKKSLHDCKEELRESSLKATPARLAVLNLLETEAKPVDVSAIITLLEKQGVKVDPVTVFRIINLFTERGLTRQVQFNEGKARYELFSRNDHHHLICESCGKIEDISDCAIGELEKEIRKKKQFILKSHSLEFFGVCYQCQH